MLVLMGALGYGLPSQLTGNGLPPMPPFNQIGYPQTFQFKATDFNNVYAQQYVYVDKTIDPPFELGGPLLNSSGNTNLKQGLFGYFWQRERFAMHSPIGYQPNFKKLTVDAGSTPLITIANYIESIFQKFIKACQAAFWCYNLYANDLPDAAFVFDKATNEELSYTIQAGGSNLYDDSSLQFASYNTMNLYRQMNYIHGAQLRRVTNYNFTNNPQQPIPEIVPTLVSITAQYQYVIVPQLHLAAVVFAFSLLLPFFMYRIVLERAAGLQGMMATMGMKTTVYWLTNYLTDYIIFLVVAVTVVIFGLAFKMVLIYQTTVQFIVTLLLWGHGQIGLSYLFAVFFSSPAKTVAFGYVWILAQIGGAWGMNAALFAPQVVPPAWYMFYPPWAFFRIAYTTAHSITTPNLCSPTQVAIQAYYAWAYIVGFGIVFLILAVYFDQILSKPGTQKKSPFFCFLMCCQKRTKRYDYDARSQKDVSVEILQDDTDVNMDIDVKEEMENIETGNIPKDSPLIVMGIVKTFDEGPQPVKAVKGVHFHIEKSEMFGLLGANGAGKTTLINILTGSEKPTSGTARIAGYDILKSPHKINQLIGFCPQFDVHWADLTVSEHLLFYSRLKGVPKAKEANYVQELIKEMGLEGERRRPAESLSGGQKRRLSIGIALTGNPAVLLLDEPSSGLDPASRRGLWEVLQKAKKNRSFCLTTHTMEEAEVLCARIGIMSKGRLKCIGDKQRLKSRFGSGYKIDVSCDVSNHGRIDNFITGLIPNIQLVTKSQSSLVYRAPQLKLSSIFEQIERNKSKYGIKNWSLSQSNLDDVFFAIVKQDEAFDENKANNEVKVDE